MPNIQYTELAEELLNDTLECSKSFRHEFVTPEHMLYTLLTTNDEFASIVQFFANTEKLKKELKKCVDSFERIPDDQTYAPELSIQMVQLIERAYQHVLYSSAEQVGLPHLVKSLLELKDLWAAYLLKEALGENEEEFISEIISWYENATDEDEEDSDELTNKKDAEKQEAW